ncbi:MAG TPA: NAD-dependent epimerase/dehydratase family protein [Bryobacteraceae bacterium]|nr:NAD-dependent epimerase/dehydratase family protein [Bryobacteraceae bacterium]
MNYAGKRILVTGGLGFIGSNLSVRLAQEGADVTILDSSVRGCGANVHNLAPFWRQIRVIDDDIGAISQHFDTLRGTEIVFNMAGEISHINSMRDPVRDLELNTTAQLRFLLGLKDLCPGVRVVYASTRQVYGVPQFLPITEAHPTNPIDFNGIHKHAAASYHRLLHARGEIDASILRLTNVYGPRMALNVPEQGVLGHFFRRALLGEDLEVFGDGQQLRDPVYVDDIVEACLLAGQAKGLPATTMNVGGKDALSLEEMARTLAAEGGGEVRFRPFPEGHKAIDIGSFSTDNSFIRNTLGWEPRVSFRDGAKRTLAYYREHREHYLP